MPVLLQICAVIVTMAIAAIAVVTVRAMVRFETAAKEFTQTAEMVRRSIAEIHEVTREVQAVTASVSEFVPRVKGMASRFENLAGRATGLSHAVVAEIAPIRSAVAVANGVRSGAARLFRALTKRPSRHRTLTNGGLDHE